MCKWRVDENAEQPEEVKPCCEEEVYILPIYKFLPDIISTEVPKFCRFLVWNESTQFAEIRVISLISANNWLAFLLHSTVYVHDIQK